MGDRKQEGDLSGRPFTGLTSPLSDIENLKNNEITLMIVLAKKTLNPQYALNQLLTILHQLPESHRNRIGVITGHNTCGSTERVGENKCQLQIKPNHLMASN